MSREVDDAGGRALFAPADRERDEDPDAPMIARQVLGQPAGPGGVRPVGVVGVVRVCALKLGELVPARGVVAAVGDVGPVVRVVRVAEVEPVLAFGVADVALWRDDHAESFADVEGRAPRRPCWMRVEAAYGCSRTALKRERRPVEDRRPPYLSTTREGPPESRPRAGRARLPRGPSRSAREAGSSHPGSADRTTSQACRIRPG